LIQEKLRNFSRAQIAMEQEMARSKTKIQNQNARRNEQSLGDRYGKIGIPAVAAALPYRSEVKSSACPSSLHRLEKWIADRAA
jgi:hypothetical protein